MNKNPEKAIAYFWLALTVYVLAAFTAAGAM